MLEEVREELKIDRLHAAAIEWGGSWFFKGSRRVGQRVIAQQVEFWFTACAGSRWPCILQRVE